MEGAAGPPFSLDRRADGEKAVWRLAGLYYVAQGKYVNGVMVGALVLGTALFIGSLVVVRRGRRMVRPR